MARNVRTLDAQVIQHGNSSSRFLDQADGVSAWGTASVTQPVHPNLAILAERFFLHDRQERVCKKHTVNEEDCVAVLRTANHIFNSLGQRVAAGPSVYIGRGLFVLRLTVCGWDQQECPQQGGTR